MSAACRRCGTCCLQGGPALHGPDLALIRAGWLHPDNLITVRRGELAVQPLAAGPEPVAREFLKLAGQGGSWCCLFYDGAAGGCRCYDHRPMACGLLDCADTGPLLAVAGQDLLTRFDCLEADDPLVPLMREHERTCPCPDLEAVGHDLRGAQTARERLARLEAAVARDLRFRERAAQSLGLSLGRELFAFGRPLFQLLLPLGIQTRNTPDGIRVTLASG
ncbi:YkgJ family cysteine cluster protein [Desulfobulbus sp.]|uniref:YkgJ family cysteine cluster protein n=1 Tax=Desulfobulbus sp. TaxID=895 RepID=UPI00286FAC6F|nr:YkgJ family cysteine cluster protein [Desulfobulbus sp.]